MHLLYTKAIIILYFLLYRPMRALDAPQTITYQTNTQYTLAKKWLQQQEQQQEQQQQQMANQIATAVTNKLKPTPDIHSPTAESMTTFKLQPITNEPDKMQLKFGGVGDIVGPTRQEEGTFCRRSFDGRSGYCILSYQCLHVIREYRVHGTKIDVCTYRRNIPVICCPLEEKHVEEQRISALKCQEYNDAAKSLKLGTPRRFSGKQCVSSLPMIVGGVVTKGGEFPHMAALGWTQRETGDIKWGCGGTLVSELYVLTAAHCATSGSKPPDMVRLGIQRLNHTNPEQQDIKILIIILHPKYRSSSYYHDIALMKLTKRATLTPRVRPACLWQLPEMDIKTTVATGWGRTEFLGAKSNELQKVDLDLIEQKLCKDLYRKERRLPRGIIDEQFCAGTNGKDTCQGDSGGPLHAVLPEYNCVSFVVGITSFGKFCAAPNAPGVYTRIYSYLDWIEKVVFRS